MGRNKTLNKAKKVKQDEFYTPLTVIEQELKHYWHHFKNKIVYLNADDDENSNFFKYFYLKFDFLKLKKLIATHYSNTQTTYKIEVYKEDNKIIKKKVPLNTNGDFRSPECIELLKQSDIVVTNPPFSLFRKFIDILIKYDKKFLILGNFAAGNYKNVFKLIKENKMWYGINVNKGYYFKVPKNYIEGRKNYKIDENGNYLISVGVNWYTNLKHNKKNKKLKLHKTYYGNEDKYPKYDNYDAINIDKIVDIPKDYYGKMGVPINFLTVCNLDEWHLIDNVSPMLNNKKKFKRLIIQRKNNNLK